MASLINDCITIENNIKKINRINDNITKTKSKEESAIFYNIDEKQINDIIETIQNFGQIINEDSLYGDYIIEMKNPIHKLTNHTGNILCLCILQDGRLVSASADHSIIIYNKISYQADLIIKELHSSCVTYITQLTSGIIATCSCDSTIKLLDIKGVKHEILQTLNLHKGATYKIIELSNKNLVSCSNDKSIIFYSKDNNQYKLNYQISTDGSCGSIVQTKDNEICYSESNNNKICFYDFLERKIKSSINNISKLNGKKEWFIMMRRDLLLIPGENKISIININQYKLVRIIEVPGAGWITGACMLNKNMLLTGDSAKIIRQWKIEGDNLVLISQKTQAHDGAIGVLLNMRNGLIASGSDDKTIKIW